MSCIASACRWCWWILSFHHLQVAQQTASALWEGVPYPPQNNVVFWTISSQYCTLLSFMTTVVCILYMDDAIFVYPHTFLSLLLVLSSKVQVPSCVQRFQHHCPLPRIWWRLWELLWCGSHVADSGNGSSQHLAAEQVSCFCKWQKFHFGEWVCHHFLISTWCFEVSEWCVMCSLWWHFSHQHECLLQYLLWHEVWINSG